MNYGQIYYNDVANGPGMRTSFFVSGCTHHCPGCFNAMTWDFNYGQEYTIDIMNKLIDSVKPTYIAGISILGGEPMELVNQPYIYELVNNIKMRYPKKSIWIYSGYTWEELTDPANHRCHGEYTIEILKNIDVLVDGEFKQELKNMNLSFRGSSNQRLINCAESLKNNTVVFSPYYTQNNKINGADV